MPTRSAPRLLVALILVSLNLRAALTSVPPLIDEISREMDLSGAAAGLITTLPVLCMGLLAPVADRLIRRIGDAAAVNVALVLLGGGLVLRAAVGSIAALYTGTVLAGAGIAIVGVVLPRVVKAHYAERAVAMTGLYVVGMGAGATLAAALSAPLAAALGSWRASLAVWAILAAAALLVWRAAGVHRSAGLPRTERPGASPTTNVWRSPPRG